MRFTPTLAAAVAAALLIACSRGPRVAGGGADRDAAGRSESLPPPAPPTPARSERLSEADVAEVLATDSAFLAGMRAGDADAIAATYVEDAVLMVPDMKPLKGRAAIRDYWAGFLKRYRVDLEAGSDELDGRGDLAYNRGHYHVEFSARAPSTPRLPAEDGKFLEILRRQPDGSWQYTVDMASGNGRPGRR